MGGGVPAETAGRLTAPAVGPVPQTPQTASRVTAARAAPPWPIKTQLSGPDSIPTLGD